MNKPTLIFGLIGSLMISSSAFAAGSGENLSGSARHSMQAIGQGTVGVVQVASAVVAVPFKAVGAIGHVSGKVGDEMLDFSTGENDQGFAITDETVTTGPSPSEAIKINMASDI